MNHSFPQETNLVHLAYSNPSMRLKKLTDYQFSITRIGKLADGSRLYTKDLDQPSELDFIVIDGNSHRTERTQEINQSIKELENSIGSFIPYF